jgi:hypothetical protein
MPFTYDLSYKNQITYITATDDVTVQSSRDAMVEWDRLSSRKPAGIIVDLSQATTLPPTSQMRQIASAIIEHKEFIKSRVAVIVKPEDIRKASIVCMLIRIAGIYMEAYGDRESAEQYLKTSMSWVWV